MQHAIALHDLCSHKSAKIAAVEVGLGYFGKVFYLVLRRIGPDLLAGVGHHFVVEAAGHRPRRVRFGHRNEPGC